METQKETPGKMETTNGNEKWNATQSKRKKKRREREATIHKRIKKVET